MNGVYGWHPYTDDLMPDLGVKPMIHTNWSHTSPFWYPALRFLRLQVPYMTQTQRHGAKCLANVQ